jgi:hypothetical protein
VGREVRDGRERGGEPGRDRGAAEGGRGGADDRDADLDRGEEQLGALAKARDRLGRSPALLDELREARPSDGDDGDLGAREEAVREDEDDEDDDLGDDGRAPLREALVTPRADDGSDARRRATTLGQTRPITLG